MMEVSRNRLALCRGCLNSCAIEPGVTIGALNCLLSVVLKDGNNKTVFQ